MSETQKVSPPAPSTEQVTYDHALRDRGGWWRGLVAIVSLVVGFLILSNVLTIGGVLIDVATGSATWEEVMNLQIGLTPGILLASNVALALMWPLSILLQWALYGVRPGFLSSVTGRFRWRWFGRLALIIVPLWIVYIGGTFVLDPGGEFSIDGTAFVMVAIVVFTTPLQAAGEEFGARGLIQRASSAWVRGPRAALVVSTLISGAVFGLAHFAADPWLIAYYFLFGVAMSLAAWGTGGLEAPILIHAINNVLIFLPGIFLGQLDEGIDRSAGAGGPFMLVPMAVVLLGAGISIWWGRRNGVQRTAVSPVPAKAAPPTPTPPTVDGEPTPVG